MLWPPVAPLLLFPCGRRCLWVFLCGTPFPIPVCPQALLCWANVLLSALRRVLVDILLLASPTTPPPCCPPCVGQNVTILGFNLGTVSEVYLVDNNLNVTLTMPAVYIEDHQKLSFIVPEWQGANHTLYVDVSDQMSTPLLTFSYAPPVFSVTFGSLPTSGGAPFQLRGSNFGRSPYAMVNGEQVLIAQVFVGGVPVVCNTDTWTDSFIECISPARQGKDVEVGCLLESLCFAPRFWGVPTGHYLCPSFFFFFFSSSSSPTVLPLLLLPLSFLSFLNTYLLRFLSPCRIPFFFSLSAHRWLCLWASSATTSPWALASPTASRTCHLWWTRAPQGPGLGTPRGWW
jgi:hypothetical protein